MYNILAGAWRHKSVKISFGYTKVFVKLGLFHTYTHEHVGNRNGYKSTTKSIKWQPNVQFTLSAQNSLSAVLPCNSTKHQQQDQHQQPPPPTATPPPHRGAARQMYGSGSLRPPGAHHRNLPPLHQQHRGALSSPPPQHQQQQYGMRRPPLMPPSPPYLYPFPITFTELRNFPIFVGADGRPFAISKTRNGPIRVPPYAGGGRMDYGQVGSPYKQRYWVTKPL